MDTCNDTAGVEPALRTLAEVSRDPVIACDRRYRIVLCNAAAEKRLGRAEAEVLGRTIWSVIPGMSPRPSNGSSDAESTAGADDWPDGAVGTDLRCLQWTVQRVRDARGRVTGAVCVRRDPETPGHIDRQLRESEERFRDFAECASDWFWETDHELRYRYVSERYEEATGLAPETRLGRRRGDFRLDGPEDGDWRSHMADLEARRPFRDFVFAYLDAHGDRRVAKVSGRPVFDDAGTFLGYRGVGCDITQAVEAEKRILYLAQHDALTGLPNRRLLKDRLQQALLTARRMGRKLAVLCIDFDDFKTVNDTLGHAAGDVLLCHAAQRMRGATRAMDTVARPGGDEFVVLQAEIRDWEDAKALAERVMLTLEEPFDLNGEPVYCGVSLGISLYPDDGDDADTLLRHADLALYRAKAAGRSSFCFFLPSMNEEVRERRQIEDDLRVALEQGELQLHYQPLVDLKSGRLTGLEALLRWPHPVRGMIPPATFIGVAERTGLILKIDRWVMQQACAQAKAWLDAGIDTGRIAINLSARQLSRSDLVETLRQTLCQSGLPPHRLEIEITESVLLTDTDSVARTLAAVDALGVGLSVDDFGTGYSSLIYLRRFPVSTVKIDRSFVASLCTNPDDDTIVRAIISLGHNLGLDVLAEGVESVDQLRYLREIGCDKAQGYHIARPMSAADCESFVRRFASGEGGLQRTTTGPDA